VALELSDHQLGVEGGDQILERLGAGSTRTSKRHLLKIY
jgi:hypothetical protein